MSMFFLWRDPKALRVSTVPQKLASPIFGQCASPPVMCCGRDEDVSADELYVRRYSVSQTAYDLQSQTSFGWEPKRDWFPASAYAVFANLRDLLHAEAALGSLFCDIHPNQGIFSPILINSSTREIVPVAKFFEVEQFLRDVVDIPANGQKIGTL